MQRLFPMFPSGPPGLGLVILRLVVATAPWLHLYLNDGAGMPVVWRYVIAALGLCVVLGAFTPLLAPALLAVLVIASCLASSLLPVAELLTMHAMASLALVLLGPGAYSLDACWFGRRRVRLRASGVERFK